MSQSELHAIEVAEKVSSTLSVIGAVFVITTFVLNKRFQKPINRLVFYAAFGNLFANVATIISRSGIKLGVDSALCQLQGFLIQWLLCADALWTFAMACNVWLTFFHQYDSNSLRLLEWKYLLFCYGLPFIPALTYLFVSSAQRGKVYGSAVLWCWVSSDWNALRIATFYGPVWLFIITNVFIYIKVGMVVLRWRKQLVSQDRKNSAAALSYAAMRDRDSKFSVTHKTCEVHIHSQVPHDSNQSSYASHSPIDFENELTSPTIPTHHHNGPTLAHEHDFHSRSSAVVQRPTRLDANKATLSYCFTALLFFIALLVTWVPSTINRLYTLIRPHSASPFGLDFSSGLVLPLQGFWNCIIYIYTSQPACKALLQDIKSCFSRPEPEPTTWTVSQPGRWKRGSRPLGSTDTRADILISLDGKRRTVVHRSSENLFPDGGDEAVPELTMPPARTQQEPALNRGTWLSEATAGGPQPLAHSQNQHSHKLSEGSVSQNSHIVDQMDVAKHKRMESEGRDMGVAE